MSTLSAQHTCMFALLSGRVHSVGHVSVSRSCQLCQPNMPTLSAQHRGPLARHVDMLTLSAHVDMSTLSAQHLHMLTPTSPPVNSVSKVGAKSPTATYRP